MYQTYVTAKNQSKASYWVLHETYTSRYLHYSLQAPWLNGCMRTVCEWNFYHLGCYCTQYKVFQRPISLQTMFIIRLQDLSATIWYLHANTNQYVRGIYCSDTTQKRFMRCKTSNKIAAIGSVLCLNYKKDMKTYYKISAASLLDSCADSAIA